MTQNRAQFATKLGVIAATVGSAVGLGNIWRFPYEAGTGGGGAFLICYIIFVLLLGVPTICAEFVLGRASHLGMPGAYRHASGSRRWDAIGYLAILAALMIMSFYAVVAGWTLEYIVDSVGGLFQATPNSARHAQFAAFTGSWRAVGWTVIFLLVNAAVMLGGVQKGIERVSNILMPLLFAILIAFCINSLLLPERDAGLEFLFKPDFSKLTAGHVLSAMGQAFFSLSLGMGCMVTYASYFKDSTPLVKTSLQIALLDTLVAILAGIIIFPAVFSFGMSPAEGPTLVFEVLPDIFHSMAGGRIWSALFFLLLAVASLTSIISISEIVVTFLCDDFRLSRLKATLSVTAIALIFGSLCSLSFGPLRELDLFNLFDYISSNILMPLGGLAACLFVGWRMKPVVLSAQLHMGGRVAPWLYTSLLFCLRYIAPAGILLVFIAGLL